MPNLETPDELAEAIADMCQVWGGCKRWVDGGTRLIDKPCPPECCRIGFTDKMARRIRDAVKNERLIEGREP